MTPGVLDYLRTKGLQLVQACLEALVGRAHSYVTNEPQYRQAAIRPGWEALPLAVRAAIGRQYKRWDDLFLRLRDEVFDLSGDTVALRPDTPARVADLVAHFFAPGPVAPPVTAAASIRNGSVHAFSSTSSPRGWQRKAMAASSLNAPPGPRSARPVAASSAAVPVIASSRLQRTSPRSFPGTASTRLRGG